MTDLGNIPSFDKEKGLVPFSRQERISQKRFVSRLEVFSWNTGRGNKQPYAKPEAHPIPRPTPSSKVCKALGPAFDKVPENSSTDSATPLLEEAVSNLAR